MCEEISGVYCSCIFKAGYKVVLFDQKRVKLKKNTAKMTNSKTSKTGRHIIKIMNELI